jgi:hypothetical protein
VNGGIGVDDAIDGVTGGTDKGKKSRMRGRSNNGVCFPLKKADPGSQGIKSNIVQSLNTHCFPPPSPGAHEPSSPMSIAEGAKRSQWRCRAEADIYIYFLW